MKTKNLILALVAIVFAVGSAFTFTPPTAIRVWVKQNSTDPNPYVCTLIPKTCAAQVDGQLCTVTITKKGGSTETVKAYSDASCTIQLRHNSSADAGSYDTGSDPTRPFEVANNSDGTN